MRGGHVSGAFAFILMATALVVSQSSSIAQSAARTGDLPVVVVVRHADKAAEPADDPPLTPTGVKRAHDLAAALRNAGVSGTITTQLRRTRETAEPLATALGLTPEVIQRGPRGSEEHLKALEAAARRHTGVVLVVGHDDTVPGLIAHLGGPRLPNICDSIYDNFFVLVPAGGKVSLMHVRYGEPTPDSECKQ
jgi:broad specificity phosphatase PhoE